MKYISYSYEKLEKWIFSSSPVPLLPVMEESGFISIKFLSKYEKQFLSKVYGGWCVLFSTSYQSIDVKNFYSLRSFIPFRPKRFLGFEI